MAESQIAGLFMTPEIYRQQQMQADRMRAMQYAQLAPEQRAAMGFFSAGQGLGRAAGTLLGAQDPQLQRITEQQRLLQGLDVADPDSLMQAARQASQAGNVPLAMQLAQQANQAVQARDLAEQRQYQLAQLQAQEQQRRAAAAAQRVGQGALQMSPATIQGLPVSESMPLRDDEGNLMPGAREGALSLNIEAVAPVLAAMGPAGFTELDRLIKARDAMLPRTQVLGREQRLVDPRTGQEVVSALPREERENQTEFARNLVAAGFTPGTPEFQSKMRDYIGGKITGAARGTGNVTIGSIGGNIPLDPVAVARAAGTDVGKSLAGIESQFNLQTAIRDAVDLIGQGIYAGAFGPEQTFAAKYAGLGDRRKVQNTEVFLANIGEIVIPRLAQFGGNDSNEELKYLQKVVAGDQRLDPESMRRILRSAERKIQNNIKRLQEQARGTLPTGPMDQSPAAASTPRPTLRLNPQTGKIDRIPAGN
jgi:hypothetical protein